MNVSKLFHDSRQRDTRPGVTTLIFQGSGISAIYPQDKVNAFPYPPLETGAEWARRSQEIGKDLISGALFSLND